MDGINGRNHGNIVNFDIDGTNLQNFQMIDESEFSE